MVYLFKIFLPSAFILVNSINSAEVNAIYADRAHRSAEANSISGNANLCRNRFERMIPDYEKAQQKNWIVGPSTNVRSKNTQPAAASDRFAKVRRPQKDCLASKSSVNQFRA